jgi:hypothetical protein
VLIINKMFLNSASIFFVSADFVQIHNMVQSMVVTFVSSLLLIVLQSFSGKYSRLTHASWLINFTFDQ